MSAAIALAGVAMPTARITVRRASAADLPALRDFIAGLSVAARASRFFVPLTELPAPLTTALERRDPLHHFLVARTSIGCSARVGGYKVVDGKTVVSGHAIVDAHMDPAEGPIVALAQYARQPPPVPICEVALVVADACQRSGLGRRLMLRLLDDAAQEGLESATGEVLRHNRAMLSLARSTGFTLQSHPEDPTLVQIVRPVSRTSIDARSVFGSIGLRSILRTPQQRSLAASNSIASPV
jgi:GNAT superfamily N-acetyltransferase